MLRVKNYIFNQNSIRNDANVYLNYKCKMVVLPSSFMNSTLTVTEYIQDTFAYVFANDSPNLFLLFNCNSA